jgi:Xaa-Pro aminopeptidase
MRTAVIERLRRAMADEALDAVVAISPENFAYVAGFVVPSQPLMRWRHAAAVVTADGRTGLLAVDMEETTVRARAAGQDVRVWGEFADNAMTVLAGLLADLGTAGGRIGIELDYLPERDFARLEAALPRAEIVGFEHRFHTLRRIKTPEEIDLLRRLSRIADRAIGEAFAAVGRGSTEMDIAAALTRSVYAQGAEQFKLMIVATGERSQLPNVGPTDRMLKPRDVCRVEIFAVIGGYHAGVCRTAVVDEPPPEAARIWANLVDCRAMLLERIGSGANARAIYDAFLAKFGALGLPPISFVGHGIGVHLHEYPYLAAFDDSTLEPGNVLGIEPLVYRTGLGFGLQLKDMVAVTEGGCELLSDFTDNQRLIVVG